MWAFQLWKSLSTWMTFTGLQEGGGELPPPSQPYACLLTASQISVLSLFLWNNDCLIISPLTVGMKINSGPGGMNRPERVWALVICDTEAEQPTGCFLCLLVSKWGDCQWVMLSAQETALCLAFLSIFPHDRDTLSTKNTKAVLICVLCLWTSAWTLVLKLTPSEMNPSSLGIILYMCISFSK